MKKIISVTVPLLLLASALSWMLLKRDFGVEKIPIAKKSTALYGCKIVAGNDASKDSQKICFAVPMQERESSLLICTARHFFDSQTPIESQVEFPSGTRTSIKNIVKPRISIDLILVIVDKEGLRRGIDYDIPVFAPLDFSDENKKADVYMDEFYMPLSRIIHKVVKEEESQHCLIIGNIEKGRSGSPVFLYGTDKCIGIVSGYYPKTKTEPALTKVVSMFNAYDLFN